MGVGNKGADVTIIVDLIDKTRGKIEKRLNKISTQSKITNRGVKGVNDQFATMDKQTKLLDRSLGKFSMQFQGWALSVMFFGMALQRIFFGIAKSSAKTFNDVMHSVEGTVTGFDRLGGSLTFLKFTVGEALEPIAASLIPVLDRITEWVSKNKELTAGIVKWGAILGTVFAVGGAGALAIAGFIDLGAKLGLVTKGLDGSISRVSLLKGALVGIQSIIGISLIIEGITDAMAGDVFKGTIEALTGAGFLALATGKSKTGKALIGLGVAMSFVDLALEGGGKLTAASFANWMLKSGGLLAFAFPPVGAALLTFGIGFKLLPGKFLAKFVSLLGVAVGALILSAATVLNAILLPIITAVNGLIGAYNLVTGNNVSFIPFTGISGAAGDRFQQQLTSAKDIFSDNGGGATTINNYQIILPDGSIQTFTGSETVQDTFDVTLRAAGAIA